MAARYSSQSGCSPLITRKYSTSGSSASGRSSTSARPSTCTHGPSKSSESTQSDTSGRRRTLRTFARWGYVDTSTRPSASTPQVTGDSCGRPSDRLVASSAEWRGRTNSSRPFRSTSRVVAIRGDMGRPYACEQRSRVQAS